MKTERWEEFHLKWLEEGSDIMVIVFESLTKDSLNETLRDISTFLNFTFDENRIDCTARHSEGRFHRKQRCIRQKPTVLKKIQGEDTSLSNTDYPSDLNDIFTEKQKAKINLAIRNVNNAILERGLTPLPISDYENTVISLNLCP